MGACVVPSRAALTLLPAALLLLVIFYASRHILATAGDPEGLRGLRQELATLNRTVRELWISTIWGRKVFSQNDEDGAIEAVFKHIGTTDKVYVEFGVENCVQCNSRHLREKLGWDTGHSLLMDGGNESPKINLKKVIFWPDNIVQLFTQFGVKKRFDFLSVDTDSYDFFMLEAILEGGYKPRAIMMEYNANYELREAKSIHPPSDRKSWQRWDGTAHHGWSLLAAKYLMERFGYSLVWCNNVNCLAVADEALGGEVRLPLERLDAGRLDAHPCDTKRRPMAVIGPDGQWSGATDGGQGSPHIRCGPEFRRTGVDGRGRNGVKTNI